MKKSIYIFVMLISAASTYSQNAYRDLMFSARLDTAQSRSTLLMPSSGNGSAGFSYHDDTLWFDVTVNGLTGPITGAHIHHGAPGVNGPVIYSLVPFISGNKIKGWITGISLGNGDLANFLEGQYYVNVHTAANPAGEIRGQIYPETDLNYRAQLDLAQAGNPGNTAFGLASINLSLDRTKLEIRVLVDSLSTAITTAHLHYGAPGVSGPPIVPIMQFNSGNTFQGFYDLNTLPNRLAFLDSLEMGHVYVNIHTMMYPNGEIRGQVYRTKTLSFDTWMTSGQETGSIAPGTPANARGLCSFSINSAADSILVYGQYDQLSGAIIGTHFHTGVAGQAGPILVDLTPLLVGYRVMGVITNSTSGAPGTTNVPEFLKDVLSDEIYVNAHTVLNPAGEVRGQPARLARKGVIYSLCAQQETGNVQGTKTGIGSGFISMDRDGMNLHFGMSVADLSGPLVGDHFHHGVHGIAGPIIFSLPTDSIINGFWDDSTFTTAVATEFMAGEIYNNFHTVLNPAGEIRGQVDSIDYCSFALGIGGTRQSAQFSVNVYPNPARETVAFDYSLPASGNVTITLFNDLGTLVSRTEQGSQLAGDHQQTYNLSVLPDGIYYYSVQLDGSAPVKGKLLVAK